MTAGGQPGDALGPLRKADIARIIGRKNAQAEGILDGRCGGRRTLPAWYDPDVLKCARCLAEIKAGDMYSRSGRSKAWGYGRRYFHAACWRTAG